MKKLLLLTLTASIFYTSNAFGQNKGFHQLVSPHSVAVTVENLNAALAARGMHVFATINHQQGASKAGLDLRPTTLVIFGNPRVGTKLMQCDQRVGLALPLKMLIWEDEAGKVWIGYWEPAGLSAQYGLEACKEVLGKVKNALAALARTAVS